MITFLVQQQTLAISCKVLQKLVYIIYNKIKKDKLQISIEVCFAPSLVNIIRIAFLNQYHAILYHKKCHETQKEIKERNSKELDATTQSKTTT